MAGVKGDYVNCVSMGCPDAPGSLYRYQEKQLFDPSKSEFGPVENYPLYIKTIPTDNELKFYYTVHTSLDVVEEKISSAGKNTNDLRELYLGLLYPTEDYKVYGYVTNSKIKFVIVVESSNASLRDNEIRAMFRKLHTAYVDMMCNPFYTPGENITSKNFDNIVTTMMHQD